MILSAETVIANAYKIKSTIKTSKTSYEKGTDIDSLKIDIHITDEKCLNIRISSLLPNNRTIDSSKHLEKCLNAELKKFTAKSKLPRFDKAFMVIIEHCITPAPKCRNFRRSFYRHAALIFA